MKKILALTFLFAFTISNAQEVEPTYEKSNDMVKATYYFQDGSLKEQGFFKDKKLTGQWISYNQKGEKTMIANYEAGKKVGKWFAWNKNTLKEITYNNNAIVSVKNWNKEIKLASNQD
ncbi:MAG: antitoxin component YwqK of YwqJK toxin-antitoxin module [Polaribacter sp.]|jgi:antitoxin component YwqK of YwqJK toxin-antitoxin module